jgi:hypothetical protein
MQVCTLEKCQLGRDDCFVKKRLERGDMKSPQADLFSSQCATPDQIAHLCHAIGKIEQLTSKYKHVWMCRPPSKTLAALNRVQRMMMRLLCLWWDGEDLWTCILYIIGAKDFAVSSADLCKCLKLPRNALPPDAQDVRMFQEMCKGLFGLCFELACADKTEKNKAVLQTVKTRLAVLQKAFHA